MSGEKKPWFAGKNQDILFYLLVAVFFIEMIVGVIAFFYGITHAAPEAPGGPPVARFPWLYWALASALAPAAFLLIVHLTGSIISSTVSDGKASPDEADREEAPPQARRFYAAVRHAPAVVILIGVLLLGASLFFIDGAFALVLGLFENLAPYLPWICASFCALLAICFITRSVLIYRREKMEREYAWRREVLEKTGFIITDGARPLADLSDNRLPPSSRATPALPEKAEILDVEPQSQADDDKGKA